MNGFGAPFLPCMGRKFVTSKSWCIRWHKGQYCFILPVANVSPSLEWNNSSYGRCQLLFNPHRMTNCFWFIFGSVPLIWRLTYCFWAISLLRKILGAWCFWTVFFIIGLAFSPRHDLKLEIDGIEVHLSKNLCLTLI